MTSVTDPGQPELETHEAVRPDPSAWTGHPGYAMPEPDRLTRFVERVWQRSPVWAAPVALFACMAGAAGYTLISNPTGAGADWVPTCLVKYTTGFDCPGCGGTRAAWFLLHGDLPAAARHHLLFVFAVPFLMYLYVAWASRALFGWRLPRLPMTPGVIGGFLAAWGIFSVLRNLPWGPFPMFFV